MQTTVKFADGTTKQYPCPFRLKTLLSEPSFAKALTVDLENSKTKVSEQNGTILAARVNNNVMNLNSKVRFDKAYVEPVYESTVVGNEIVRHTILFMLSMATHQLFPEIMVTAEHHLGWGYLCEARDMTVTPQVCEQIEQRLHELAQRNLDILQVEKAHDDALEYFTTVCPRPYTIALLKRINDPSIILDYCDGYYEIHTRPLAYNTSVFNTTSSQPANHKNSVDVYFKVKYHSETSFVISFPPDPFQLHYVYDDSEVIKVYKEANSWGKFMENECVGELNKKIREGKIKEFILKSHALHDRKIAQIAQNAHDKKTPLILIAGPSASGKTTFSKKLAIQLEILGLEPVVFSVDDYYKPRAECPRNAHGDYDFECLEALRVDLLNEHLVKLLAGQVVQSPIYDFKLGHPIEDARTFKLPKRAPVVVMEGIHCLNPKLTPLIPDQSKFRIFVAPLIQLNVTEFNFISSARTRLLRRIVRDFRTRGHSVQSTLKMWPTVRQGEHQFIFPFINTADAILDTSLDYEFSAIKIIAKPLLNAVPPSDQYYYAARELINFLSAFDPIPHDNIPTDSLIREFIGGSFFEE